MRLHQETTELRLAAGEVISLDDAVGARITACRGTLWLTEEGSVDDTVLEAGDVFRISRAGRTVLQAIESTDLAIFSPTFAEPEAETDSSWLLQHPDEMVAEMRSRFAIGPALSRYY